MPTTLKQAFSEWLEQKYLDWQAERGTRSSLKEFADYIGYSRPLISFWLGAQRLPAEDGVKRLAELFGPEVYDVLELPRPDPDLTYIQKQWDRLPHEMRDAWVEEAERYFAANIALRELENDKEPPPKRPASDNVGDHLAVSEPATTRRDSAED